MPKLVVHGASLKCGEGAAPATLSVLPANATDSESHALATVDDYVPMVNIGSFGMRKTQANPQVAAATAAAQGVLTPMPCIPVTTSAWSPGASGASIQRTRLLTVDSTCKCQWGGTIEISNGATDVETAG